MMSPKMIAGMLSGLVTDDNIQKLQKGLSEYMAKKQEEKGGPAARFQLVIETTEDNTDVRVILWLTFTNDNTPEMIFKQELSKLSADQLKNLIKDYAG